MKCFTAKGVDIIDLVTTYEVTDINLEDLSLPIPVWNLLAKLKQKPATIHEVASSLQAGAKETKTLLKYLAKEGICTPLNKNINYQEWSGVKKEEESVKTVEQDIVVLEENEISELETSIDITNSNTKLSEEFDICVETDEEVISMVLA